MPLLNLSVSQLLWVFVASNILKKLGPNVLFLRWLASKGLACYRVPNNEQLKRLNQADRNESKKNQSKPSKARTKSSDHGGVSRSDEFKLKSSDLIRLELSRVEIDYKILASAPYGEQLEWVADFACMSIVSFILLEILFYFSPKTSEYNFSLVWIFLVITICLLYLLQLTSIYFRNQVSVGERSICIVSGCIFLLISMVILTIDESRLELGLNDALRAWTLESSKSPDQNPLSDPAEVEIPNPVNRPSVAILTRIIISIFCAFVGIIFTFPGLRFGQLHNCLLAESDVKIMNKVVYNFNYLAPLVLVLLWVPPVSRKLLNQQDVLGISDTKFEALRVLALICVNLTRFLLVRNYTKVFLLSTPNRIDKIRFRGGTTTSKEIQSAVGGMNNYVNVVNMQYILPTLICLYSSIMYAAFKYNTVVSPEQSAKVVSTSDSNLWLLTSGVPENIFNLATWWFHFSWFCTSTAGVVYHKYFIH